jgi:hypothetical protein
LLSRPVLVPVARQALAALAMFAATVLGVVPSNVGCGAPKTTDGAAGAPLAAAPKDGATDAGVTVASPAGGPATRPFAGSAAEATQLIGTAVDKKSAEVQKCVIEYRTRKNLPRERVSIQLGIDQEGRLLGATLPKGKSDTTLSECVQRALADAPFPRSHTGVISITKSYEEIVQ